MPESFRPKVPTAVAPPLTVTPTPTPLPVSIPGPVTQPITGPAPTREPAMTSEEWLERYGFPMPESFKPIERAAPPTTVPIAPTVPPPSAPAPTIPTAAAPPVGDQGGFLDWAARELNPLDVASWQQAAQPFTNWGSSIANLPFKSGAEAIASAFASSTSPEYVETKSGLTEEEAAAIGGTLQPIIYPFEKIIDPLDRLNLEAMIAKGQGDMVLAGIQADIFGTAPEVREQTRALSDEIVAELTITKWAKGEFDDP